MTFWAVPDDAGERVARRVLELVSNLSERLRSTHHRWGDATRQLTCWPTAAALLRLAPHMLAAGLQQALQVPSRCTCVTRWPKPRWNGPQNTWARTPGLPRHAHDCCMHAQHRAGFCF